MVLNPLLTKVLWFRRTKSSFALAGLAFLFGLVLMLISIDAYLKVTHISEAQKKKGTYLVINKKISLINTLGLSSSSFSKEELAEIEKKPFVQKFSIVSSNRFKAAIQGKSPLNFYTLVFFEAVKPAMLDVPASDFQWNEKSKTVPIVISQDFLNLYNFGFAFSQNLPQLSREAIKMIPFEVVVEGPGGKEVLNGKIVGFTERLTSVLVPLSFMDWANQQIGKEKPTQPSRIIVQVQTLSDPAVKAFLEKNDLQTDFERVNMGKTGSILNAVLTGLGGLGLIFSVLAFVMFSMNFRLVMAEAASDIRLLIELGYKHKTIAINLMVYFAGFVGLMAAMALAVSLAGISRLQSAFLLSLPAEIPSTHVSTLVLSALFFCLSIVVLNSYLIVRQLQKI